MTVAAASAAAGLGAEPSPQGFTLSPDGWWTFVSAKAIDRVVELASARVVTFLPSGSGPDGIAFTRCAWEARGGSPAHPPSSASGLDPQHLPGDPR